MTIPVLLALWTQIPKTLVWQIRMPLGQVLFQRSLQRGFTPPDKSCSFSKYHIEIFRVFRKPIRIRMIVNHFVCSTRVPTQPARWNSSQNVIIQKYPNSNGTHDQSTICEQLLTPHFQLLKSMLCMSLILRINIYLPLPRTAYLYINKAREAYCNAQR